MSKPPRPTPKSHPTSDRAAVLHRGHSPVPALVSTRAAWLRESRAWTRSAPASARQQAAWRQEDLAWQQSTWQQEGAAWQQAWAAAATSDRAVILHRPPQHKGAFGVVPGTHRYYIALFGAWNDVYFEVDTAYLIIEAHQLANSLTAWYEASHLVAEASLKVDAGIQGRVEGIVWGLKAKADLNVVKADLFEVKMNLREPFEADSYKFDHAGKDDKTKISNGASAQIEVPWLPKTPWGKLAVGGNYEQSQWINANMASSNAAKDWGVYAVIPIAQPEGLKAMSDKIKANPNTQMAKGPSISTKNGKQKKFYGADVGVGAAALVGVNVKIKVGLQ